jgi:hypothetical protein
MGEDRLIAGLLQVAETSPVSEKALSHLAPPFLKDTIGRFEGQFYLPVLWVTVTFRELFAEGFRNFM